MPIKTIRISKSQFLKGLQCPKALWLYRHRPDLYPEISETQQHIFDMGHEIGELAQRYFKNGIEITGEYYEIDKAIKSTQKAIRDGHQAIFEATACSVDNAYSKIDILKKVRGSDSWDMIEVKGSSSVKDYHIEDAAFQRYAFTQAGYKIRKSILMHVNNGYVRQGEIDLKKLFTLQDITKDIKESYENVPDELQNLTSVLRKRKEPVIDIGGHCYSPFTCDYEDYCWNHIPDYSVYNIFRNRKLESLISDGIIDPIDVPDDFDMTERERIDVQSYTDGNIHVDKKKIRGFLGTLKYPLYYLDYETINPAIPLFNGTSPYQQIPFQFSLHIQSKKDGDLKHIEFLHTDKTDPRPSFIKELVKRCKKRGSVVVYNRGFENRINNELASAFPEYKDALDAISNRMVDLLIPFRSRHLYHPDMMGSASIKSVLPAFVPDMSYVDLEISDGGTASLCYLECLKDIVPDNEQEAVFQNLRDYCGQDTMAEVKLLEILYGFVK